MPWHHLVLSTVSINFGMMQPGLFLCLTALATPVPHLSPFCALLPLQLLCLVCPLGMLSISVPYCLCSSCTFSMPYCPCSSCTSSIALAHCLFLRLTTFAAPAPFLCLTALAAPAPCLSPWHAVYFHALLPLQLLRLPLLHLGTLLLILFLILKFHLYLGFGGLLPSLLCVTLSPSFLLGVLSSLLMLLPCIHIELCGCCLSLYLRPW